MTTIRSNGGGRILPIEALFERLATDTVPLIGSGGGYGFDWKPEGGWIVYPKPTLAHEASGCLSYLQQKAGRTLRVAEITNQQTPTFADLSAVAAPGRVRSLPAHALQPMQFPHSSER